MEPFSKRTSYTKSSYINKESFQYLSDRLHQIGFTKQDVILPTLIIDDKKIKEGPADRALSVDEFLGLDQDFEAVVFSGSNQEKTEEVVILFKNDPKKKVKFDSPIFSLVDSNQNLNLYVSTLDPVRTFGLITYLKDYFKGQ